MPKAPVDIRVCVPGVIVRFKNVDSWVVLGGEMVPGDGKVVSWEAGNASNGVRVAFKTTSGDEMGQLLCAPDEIELVACDETEAALVQGILSHSKLEDVLQDKPDGK